VSCNGSQSFSPNHPAKLRDDFGNTMTILQSEQLYLTIGLVLFCAGTLLGIPHGRSKRRGDAKNTELWRIAHLSTCVGGVSVLVLSMALPRLFASDAGYILAPFDLSAYCFFIACTLSGWLNKSWDGDRRELGTALVYWLQIGASMLSVIAVATIFLMLIWKLL
jgi:hypothetical protein